MSAEQVYIVDELKRKIQLLAERLETEKNENSKLQLENSGLEGKLKEQELELIDIKQQNNTLKLSKAFASENEDSQEAKMQINKIVREIDKCIALLNR